MRDEACVPEVMIQQVTTSNSWVFWVLLVVGLLIAAVVIGVLLRKRVKRDMDKEIKMQVSTAVDHYFALTDKTINEPPKQ